MDGEEKKTKTEGSAKQTDNKNEVPGNNNVVHVYCLF